MKVTKYNNGNTVDVIEIIKYAQSGFRFDWDNQVVYIDPIELPEAQPKADVVFVTHPHYDHFQPDQIRSILKPESVIVAPESMKGEIAEAGFNQNSVVFVSPAAYIDAESQKVSRVPFLALPAYNLDKFREDDPTQVHHPKEANWCGYIIRLGSIQIYHTGDTDLVPEMNGIPNIDYLLVPVSGTYVMTSDEAFELVKLIGEVEVIPMHYDYGIGSRADAERLAELVAVPSQVEILEKI